MKLDHLGIATKSLTDSKAFYRDALGLTPAWEETVERDGVRVAAFTLGEAKIEVLEPLRSDSPVGKFLASRGEGLHHICFEVEDLEGTLKALKARGVPLIDEVPRPGAHGRRIAFVHPRGAHGVLLELTQKPR